MKVQVKVSNGDKEVCVVMDEVEVIQSQGIVDVLREFFLNVNTICNSDTLKGNEHISL